MPVGRPPKPIEQKRLTGRTPTTDSGGRPLTRGTLATVSEYQPEDHELSVPESLDRVLKAGVHWIASTDSPTVALLRDALEDYADLRASKSADPKAVVAVRKQLMELLSSLGFDPAARSRLGLAEVKAQSKVEEIIARRRDRTQD